MRRRPSGTLQTAVKLEVIKTYGPETKLATKAYQSLTEVSSDNYFVKEGYA